MLGNNIKSAPRNKTNSRSRPSYIQYGIWATATSL